MLKFYAKILKEDYHLLLNDTPSSKKKVEVLGSVLFVPVILWVIQGFLMSYMILKLSIFHSIIISSLLGFLIFIVERAIVTTPGRSTVLRCFRLGLGVFIAALGSIIMDEIIFHNDIDNQMVYHKNRELKPKLDSLDSYYAPRIAELRDLSESNYNEWKLALEEVKSEADGTGGSGIKGVSEITKTKMALTEQQKMVYEGSQTDYKNEINKLKQEKENLRSEFITGFSENSLLTRIKVMINFIANDKFMLIIYILFTAILFCLEFIVLIIKMTYPETNYERKIKILESIGAHRLSQIEKRDLKIYHAGNNNSSVKSANQLLSSKQSILN